MQLYTGYHEWPDSDMFLICFSSFIIGYVFFLSKNYKMDFDQYAKYGRSVYIVFRKPDNFFGFIIGLFGRFPVDTVSVVHSGYQYFYKKDIPYHIRPFKTNSNYVFIRTGFDVEYVDSILNPLIANEWSMSDNCCHAVLRLYKDIKRTKLLALPCFLMSKIIKEEKKCRNQSLKQ
jgi:hypothetical protein